MKKIYLALIVMLVLTGGCVTTKANPDEVSLNTAIREAASLMENRLSEGTRVALVNFTSPSQVFSEYVLDQLSGVLVNSGKLIVVDRANLDRIRQELGFNASGEVSDASAQEIGKMLGAQAVVTGTYTVIGDLQHAMFKTIVTETAAVAVQHNADIANDRRIQALLASDAGASAGGGSRGVSYSGTSAGNQGSTTASGGSVSSETGRQATATPTYRVGDTGPAGGLIFYDKGNNMGGWRYLEVAPVNTETRAKFNNQYHYHGSDTFDENQTSEDLGRGKENSEYLLSRMAHFGYWNTAVQYCDDLAVNSFDDWYLPSTRELSYIYGNLVRRELGGFRDALYWSSSGNDGSGSGQISYGALTVNMRDGMTTKKASDTVTELHYVRAVRRF